MGKTKLLLKLSAKMEAIEKQSELSKNSRAWRW